MVLKKVHILLVSPSGAGSHKAIGQYPAPRIPCRFTDLTGRSEKVQLYSQTVQTYRTMRRSKSGLHHFTMAPQSEFCRDDDVPPFALLQMVELGEAFAGRYRGQVVPHAHAVPDGDTQNVRSLAGQEFFQTAAAFLHGLLPEKQFMCVRFRKLERHMSGGLGSPCWCDNICHVDQLVQRAYRDEHEVFKDRDMVFFERKRLYDDLNVRDYQSAKQLVRSISPWLCELKSNPCRDNRRCLNVTHSHVNQLLNAVRKHNHYMSTNDLFVSYAASDTRVYFRDMFSWFQRTASHESFKVDVVDDFFLLKVLGVLGVAVDGHIFPGSQLVIEQYQKKKSKGSGKFWRILYNGEVVTGNIPSCQVEVWRGVCGAEAVIAHVDQLVKGSMFGTCASARDEL